MKNKNRIQNAITDNQDIIFESVPPQPQPGSIGELLTLTEIEDAIRTQVVLSDAVATALAT